MTIVVDLVKRFEGFERVARDRRPVMAVPYLCPANYWTIGYGHVCRQDHPSIDQATGELYLADDLAIAAVAVHRLITRPLEPNQLAALTSWTFNLGSGRLQGSRLRAVINRGELSEAPGEIRRWVYAGGSQLPGLVARREAEAALFIG